MKKHIAFAASLFLLAPAVLAQTSRLPAPPAQCSCSSGPLIDARGNLNMSHCNAPLVLQTLDRYADRSSRLLPERVETADIQAAQGKLDTLRREIVQSLLAFMTWEDLNRFLPMLTNLDNPQLGAQVNHGFWLGAQLMTCENALYWINQALDKTLDVDQVLILLGIETNMYPTNPAGFCNPDLLSYSTPYLNGTSLLNQTRGWLQFAADSMSQEAPAAAALGSFLGWWRAFQGSLSFGVAWESFPIMGDARCTEVADAALALGVVGQAAHLGYERAELCAQGQ